MRRFIIPRSMIDAGAARFPREEAIHATRVLRMEAGAMVEICDGAGARFLARLETVENEEVTARVLAQLDAGEAPVQVTLYQGYPKREKLEWILQKATELGVSAIVPVDMERCVARVEPGEWAKKESRYLRILDEAVKQCGRANAPKISAPIPFAQLPERAAAHALALVPWEEARGARLRDAYADRPDATDIAVVIGPEGGMTEIEARALESAGARLLTLGPRILRTETAAIAVCACVLSMWGDL